MYICILLIIITCCVKSRRYSSGIDISISSSAPMLDMGVVIMLPGLLGDLLPGLIARKLSGVSGGLWGLGMPSGVGN